MRAAGACGCSGEEDDGAEGVGAGQRAGRGAERRGQRGRAGGGDAGSAVSVQAEGEERAVHGQSGGVGKGVGGGKEEWRREGE